MCVCVREREKLKEQMESIEGRREREGEIGGNKSVRERERGK